MILIYDEMAILIRYHTSPLPRHRRTICHQCHRQVMAQYDMRYYIHITHFASRLTAYAITLHAAHSIWIQCLMSLTTGRNAFDGVFTLDKAFNLCRFAASYNWRVYSLKYFRFHLNTFILILLDWVAALQRYRADAFSGFRFTKRPRALMPYPCYILG